MTEQEFIKEMNHLGIALSQVQLQKFKKYYEFLVEYNKKVNITRILDIKEVYLKHFYDSATLVLTYNFNEHIKVCDFGTGAGFPGIVLKILFPEIDLTLVESSSKKSLFLQKVLDVLQINDVTILNERVEEITAQYRETFDVVTCRAVSRLDIIMELAISLVKIKGYFIPLKANIDEELDIIKKRKICEKLGCCIENTFTFNLPFENSIRNIILIKKTDKTSEKYPRKYDQIIRKAI